jgi:hypothetical protein
MILEKEQCLLFRKRKRKCIGLYRGYRYATEVLEHNISISAKQLVFKKSMKMALENTDLSEVDVVVMHALNIKGDVTEYKAIEKGTSLPLLTTNKWKIGHTLCFRILSMELLS